MSFTSKCSKLSQVSRRLNHRDLGLSLEEPNSCLLLWSKHSGRTTVSWSKQGRQFGLNANHAVPKWCLRRNPTKSQHCRSSFAFVVRTRTQEHVVTWRPGWWSEQCHQHATPGSTNDTRGMGGVSRKRRVRSWDPMGCLYQLALVWGLLLLILCYPLLFIESEPLWLKANSFSKPCSGIIGFRNAMSFWLVTTYD